MFGFLAGTRWKIGGQPRTSDLRPGASRPRSRSTTARSPDPVSPAPACPTARTFDDATTGQGHRRGVRQTAVPPGRPARQPRRDGRATSPTSASAACGWVQENVRLPAAFSPVEATKRGRRTSAAPPPPYLGGVAVRLRSASPKNGGGSASTSRTRHRRCAWTATRRSTTSRRLFRQTTTPRVCTRPSPQVTPARSTGRPRAMMSELAAGGARPPAWRFPGSRRPTCPGLGKAAPRNDPSVQSWHGRPHVELGGLRARPDNRRRAREYRS